MAVPTLPAGCGQVEAVPPDVVCTADEVPVIAAAVLAIVVVEPRVWRVYGVFMVMVRAVALGPPSKNTRCRALKPEVVVV